MKKYFWIFIITFVLYWGLAPLRGVRVEILGLVGFRLSATVGFVAMLALTLFSLLKWRQLKPGYVLLAVWLGISIIELPYLICVFLPTLGSFPTYLLWCWGIITGYFAFLGIRKVKQRLLFMIVAFLCLVVGFWSAIFGYQLFLDKLTFGTYTGKVAEREIENPVEFQNSNGENISLTDFSEKYLILDFWNSGCGNCIRKFPEVQAVFNKYKDVNRFVLFGVHCRQVNKGETVDTGNRRLIDRGYTFPNLSIAIDDPILKEIGIEGFPTVVVFNPQGRLVFRGSIENAASYIKGVIH